MRRTAGNDAGPGWRRALVLLLCGLVTYLSLVAPRCERCDGPRVVSAATAGPVQVRQPAAATADLCNGVCVCCGYHVLPVIVARLERMEVRRGQPRREKLPVTPTALFTIFRPPRFRPFA